MKTFEQTVCDFILEQRLVRPGQKVIAAVSGGADSTALLLVLDRLRERLGILLEAVHVEHGIRGEESKADEAFVRQLCSERGILLTAEKADVPSLARERGESLEEAARNLRLEVFDKVLKNRGADRIALAHHQDDQAETVLFNLLRGTGLAGLSGMRPERGRIIRPLLCVTREDIEAWLTGLGQPWRTDSTNLGREQVRNRIRLDILPLITREVNTAASRHILEASQIVREAADHLEKEIDRLEEKLVVCEGKNRAAARIRCRDLETLDKAMASGILRRMTARVNELRGLKDLSNTHIRDVLALAGKGGGKKTDLPGDLEAVREGDDLVIRAKAAGRTAPGPDPYPELQVGRDGVYVFGGHRVSVRYLSGKEAEDLSRTGIPEKKYTKWLSCDKMMGTVCLRTRRSGDHLVINAGGGRKSLKDYLIDEKVPAPERDKVIVAAQDSHVLWVVGHRISYGARVTPESERIVCISFEEDESEHRESSICLKEEPCLRM